MAQKTLSTLGWKNIYPMYQKMQLQDKTTADEKIVAYIESQIKATVEQLGRSYGEVKRTFQINCVYDKRSKKTAELKKLTANDPRCRKLEAEIAFANMLDAHMYAGNELKNVRASSAPTLDRRVKYVSSDMGTEAKWKYRLADLQNCKSTDPLFWQSVADNLYSARKDYPEKCAEYYGVNYDIIIETARNYCLQRKAECKAEALENKRLESTMTLSEKIEKGIAVVITPEVIAELAKIYPKAWLLDTAEETAIKAARQKAEDELAAEAEAARKREAELAAEAEKLLAEIKAEEEALKAKKEAALKAEKEAKAAEEAALKAERAAKLEAERKEKLETATDEEKAAIKHCSKLALAAKIARKTMEFNATPEPTPEPTDSMVADAAAELEAVIKATDDLMIHGYELEFDWDDIDEMIEKIIAAYPDSFEYDEDSDEIRFYPNEEGC